MTYSRETEMARQANTIDKHVGARVRMRRIMLGMSQEKLGKALALTFQQIQKYEKGSNRIGASRLHQISMVLNTPVSFFFDGAPNTSESGGNDFDLATRFMSCPGGAELAEYFIRINEAAGRRLVIEMAERLASALSVEKLQKDT
jgi:transcriptional regulator with XRE-family HTH domain